MQNSDEISHMLISSLKDSSSLTIKQALSGIKLLIPQLLEADLVSSTSRLVYSSSRLVSSLSRLVSSLSRLVSSTSRLVSSTSRLVSSTSRLVFSTLG